MRDRFARSRPWHHVAYVRSGNRWMTFLNERKEPRHHRGRFGDQPRRIECSLGDLGWDRATHFDGLIDDFRVSSVVRHTENFEPAVGFEPTRTWPAWLTNGHAAHRRRRPFTRIVGGQLRLGSIVPSLAPRNAHCCTSTEASTDADGDPITHTFTDDHMASPHRHRTPPPTPATPWTILRSRMTTSGHCEVTPTTAMPTVSPRAQPS